MTTNRRLAAILAADVVGYSRLVGQDEAGTLSALKSLRTEVTDPKIVEHKGRIFKTTGDGVLAEFASVVDAVACAVDIQRTMAARNANLPEVGQIAMRVGVNLGDVVIEGDDVLGDGVNVAARLEAVAAPGEVAISGTVRDHVGNKLDMQFDDMGEHPLKNIDRPVRIYRPRIDRELVVPNVPLSLPDKPSIAVLPFQNMSGDPEQEYFADGMVEEIITGLSRLRWLFVIARNSSFAYKGRNVDVKQVGRDLGVRYVMEGSVRRAGDRLRITGQLIDTTTGNHIWADRYDGGLSDVFDLQDRIAESVVGAMQPTLLSAEIERSRRKRPESLLSYDYVLRAFPLVWTLLKADNEAARDLLEQAVAIEPNYPLALSLLAWCHTQRAVYNWTEDLTAARDEGLVLAQKAASLSRDDPMVLAILGAAHTVARDYEIANAHLERALALDPNSAWAWHRSGWLQVHREHSAPAIEHFERAMRLSPFDPMNHVCLFGIAAARFVEGRYDDAVEFNRKAFSQQPQALWALRVHVPALIHAGHTKEAEKAFAMLTASYPGLTLTKVNDALPFGAGTMERIMSGLRKAGLPE